MSTEGVKNYLVLWNSERESLASEVPYTFVTCWALYCNFRKYPGHVSMRRMSSITIKNKFCLSYQETTFSSFLNEVFTFLTS